MTGYAPELSAVRPIATTEPDREVVVPSGMIVAASPTETFGSTSTPMAVLIS